MLLNHKPKITFLLIAIAVFLIYFTSGWWFRYCNDAYIYTDLVQVTPQISGFIKQVYVQDNQEVKKGQLLMQIDETPFALKVRQNQAALAQAQDQLQLLIAKKTAITAELSTAQDKLKLANDNLKRYQDLVKTGAISQQIYDQNTTTQKVAQSQTAINQAQVVEAEKTIALQQSIIESSASQLALAEYNLSQTKIYAASDGYINNLNVFAGDYVTSGKALFGLINRHNWRVVANYQSNDVTHIHPGDLTLLYISGYPLHIFFGRVESIGRAVAREPTETNPALPYIQPVTSWIRYPYRFPVRIKFDQLPDDIQLQMGADVRTFVL